jgi:ribosome-associated toxin RatA of RatAB toxin-antitoxin module
MALITSTRRIAAAPQSVYDAARDVKRFAEVLPEVDDITIVEDQGNGTVVTKWDATITVGPLTRSITWTEKDLWNDDDLSCTFKLLHGDMKTFDGTWTFRDDGGAGCIVDLRVDFELGIPVLGPMVNSIVNKLMQKNCDEMLAGLERMTAGNMA